MPEIPEIEESGDSLLNDYNRLHYAIEAVPALEAERAFLAKAMQTENYADVQKLALELRAQISDLNSGALAELLYTSSEEVREDFVNNYLECLPPLPRALAMKLLMAGDPLPIFSRQYFQDFHINDIAILREYYQKCSYKDALWFDIIESGTEKISHEEVEALLLYSGLISETLPKAQEFLQNPYTIEVLTYIHEAHINRFNHERGILSTSFFKLFRNPMDQEIADLAIKYSKSNLTWLCNSLEEFRGLNAKTFITIWDANLYSRSKTTTLRINALRGPLGNITNFQGLTDEVAKRIFSLYKPFIEVLEDNFMDLFDSSGQGYIKRFANMYRKNHKQDYSPEEVRNFSQVFYP